MNEDIIFPTDNALDIPVLLPERQQLSGLVPLRAWGSVSRATHAQGGWHFFVDDYRFTSLLKNPLKVLETQPLYLVEPNISIFDQTPRALAIERIYRKRYITRLWQNQGLRVLVDMNVPERFLKLNLTGVPQGWRAYATRGYRDREEDLIREYDTAAEHAKKDVVFLVVGGGSSIRQMCESLSGAIYFEGR